MQYMSKSVYNAILKAKQETCELNGWILVTPDLAAKILKFNTRNYRVLNNNVVEKYAKDMKYGLWERNGETIAISKDGLLRNGQHRLNAIIKSGTPVLMYMIFDTEKSTVYDVQYKRTCVQVLREMGFSCSPIIPAIARTIFLGKITTCSIGDAKVCEYVTSHYHEMKQAEMLVKARVGCARMAANKASCATIAYCLLRTNEVSYDDMSDFFIVLNSGKKCGINKDVSSALALRKQILSYAGHSDNLSNRFMQYTYLALKDFVANTAVDKDYVYPDGGRDAERLIQEVQRMDNI